MVRYRRSELGEKPSGLQMLTNELQTTPSKLHSEAENSLKTVC